MSKKCLIFYLINLNVDLDINSILQLNYLDLVENKQKNFIFDEECKNMSSEIENFQYIDNLEEIKGKLFSVILQNKIIFLLEWFYIIFVYFSDTKFVLIFC